MQEVCEERAHRPVRQPQPRGGQTAHGAVHLARSRSVREDGKTEDVFRSYVKAHASSSGGGFVDLSDLSKGRHKQLEHKISFESIELRTPDGEVTDTHLEGDPISFNLVLRCNESVDDEFEIMARIRTPEGVFVVAALSAREEVSLRPGRTKRHSRSIPISSGQGPTRADLTCSTA